MNKKITLTLVVLSIVSLTNAQDLKKEVKTVETKMEAFASKTGTITKFVDTKLPNLKLYLGSIAVTRIRKLTSGNDIRYFYQIEKEGKYSSNTASIEHSDLLEVIKALGTLKTDVEKDLLANPDYLENKFVTVDGFQLGYYISDGKSKWYLKLEKFGSDNTIFINDYQTIEIAFLEAKAKIEELKK